MRKIVRIVIVLVVVTAAVLFAAGNKEQETDYTDPAQLFGLIQKQSSDYLLLDVRTAPEYESGHITTAENLSVTDIEANPPKVAKDALIIVYCRSGSRSHAAAVILKDLGYTNVVDFGGITRWNYNLVT